MKRYSLLVLLTEVRLFGISNSGLLTSLKDIKEQLKLWTGVLGKAGSWQQEGATMKNDP